MKRFLSRQCPHGSAVGAVHILWLLAAVGAALFGCRNPTVVEYEPYASPQQVEPNDPLYVNQWHYRQINMPGAWGILADPDLGGAFSRVMVAVIDDGIRDVVDLQVNLFLNTSDADGGWDFYDDDPDPTDPSVSFTHGTHVSGSIAAAVDNSIGVAGIGWDRIEVLPVRALGDIEANNTTDKLNQALYYVSQSSDGAVTPPSKRSVVVNLSLGGLRADQAMYEAIQYAVDKGITVVAAAGNDSGGLRYPAAFDNTIAVSATTAERRLAWYSNRGPGVDFAAPGGDEDSGVLSTVEGGYAESYGTSMAAPHVSGVVGLLYSYAPGLTQDAVYAILANTAQDLGTPGHDEEYGHGLIDAEAALEYLINAGLDYPVRPMTEDGGNGGAVSALAAQGAGMNRGRRPARRQGAVMPAAGEEYARDSVIVRLTATADRRPGAARSLAAGIGARGVRHLGGALYRIDLPPGGGLEAALRALGTHAEVEYVQPNYRYEIIR